MRQVYENNEKERIGKQQESKKSEEAMRQQHV